MSGSDYGEQEEPQRSRALTTRQITDADLKPLSATEIAIIQGDLSVLSAAQRVEYYKRVCESVGLNPLTRPFDYLILNGKLTLYARKDATDQLRSLHVISIDKLERSTVEDIFLVTAYGRDRTGRTDSSIGAVSVGNLRGDAKANAMMKAETKAKRRLTLSLAGLGFLDETETGTIEGAARVDVDDSGEIVGTALELGPEKSLREKIIEEATEAATVTEPTTTVSPSPETPEEAAEPVETPESSPEVTDAASGTPGLSWDEFKRLSREKHVLLGAASNVARGLFSERNFDDPKSLKDGLSDVERLTVLMAAIATQDNSTP